MDQAEMISEKARSLGFDAVGFALPEAVTGAGDDLVSFLGESRHGEMYWLAERLHERRAPANLWPEVKSVVALAMNYGPGSDPLDNLAKRGVGNVSVYARGKDYHKVMKKRLKALGRWMAETLECEVKVFVDRTAVRGNLLGSAGMLLAIVVTLLDKRIVSFEVIVAGFVVGGLIGAVMAYRVSMNAMPQMVAVLNGLGGGASALAVGAALEEALKGGFVEEISVQFTLAAAASGLIGSVAFTGSAIAFGKLQSLIKERPVLLPGRHAINLVLALACLGLSGWLVMEPTNSLPFGP